MDFQNAKKRYIEKIPRDFKFMKKKGNVQDFSACLYSGKQILMILRVLKTANCVKCVHLFTLNTIEFVKTRYTDTAFA